MNPAHTASTLRAELRRKTAWLVGIVLVLGLVNLAIFPLPSGRDWRAVGAIFGLISAALAVTIIGSWFLRRPLLEAITALERQAGAAESERSRAELLAGAGRVAASLAHEVGNPLCAIANYAHSLEEKVPPELRGTLGSLRREVSRIERLVDGFLDHARPREPGSRGAEVKDALRETLGFLGDQGILRRITLETRLDGRPLPVRGTPLDLEQTFAN
ncbi:MAG TPA: histidine kinase dimerization/phospho-acceptor domain-containing protein, partial [Gemmatimonadaceae bacterium]